MEGGHVARYGAANLGPGREKYETHCLLRMAEKRKKELTIVMDCGATLNQSRPALHDTNKLVFVSLLFGFSVICS